MADKAKFVGDFRGAVSDLLTAIDRLDVLDGTLTDLGWVQGDFTGVTGELTAAEFFAAVSEWQSVSANVEASIPLLTKLKP